MARVISVQRNHYRISDGECVYLAQVSGKFYHQIASSLDFPAVGDWVVADKRMDEQKAVIQEILPRKSQCMRQAPGEKTEAQLIAANVDTILIVSSLNADFNARRIERYMIFAYESGAVPVIVLTKKDECGEATIASYIQQVEDVAFGVPIVTVSSVTGEGIPVLMTHLPPRNTATLLGSSGVGKSTLVNALLGEHVQQTKDIRADDHKGRHTTTHREMFQLPSGALLIDTPGMRELQLWDGEQAMDTAFNDVEQFTRECRFLDCQHDTEPDCRVKEALASGELTEERYESYLKLQREIAFEKRKQDQKAQIDEKQKWKQMSKNIKATYRHRGYK
ncbi:ribosome small subunit-dependent GTPase A [Bacillaceae bacterium SIJ1]|nr:ribosome small subunit-dependent GTPase A [Litoribacterium kuwaitense]